MSHSKERSEKDCLNCGTIVQGRYCQVCGQENIVPKESLWGLVSHFFQDITHFDGKFFSTGKLLLQRPGFLPKEYIAGRRARYLHPIRMYVFSSAVFFLIFYSLFNVNNWNIGGSGRKKDRTENLKQAKRDALDNAKTAKDSEVVEQTFALIGSLPVPVNIEVDNSDTSVRVRDRDEDDVNLFSFRKTFVNAYDTRAEYDSIQARLPADERDGWFQRQLEYRDIEFKKRYGDDESRLYKDVIDKFMHTFPYLLFISLPLYALFLKLLYIRRKQFYFADHALWLIYLYIFTFLWLLIFFGLREVENRFDAPWVGFISFVFMLYGIWYAYKAMRVFYGQQRWKTILKFILLNVLASVAISFLFVIFLFYSVLRL